MQISTEAYKLIRATEAQVIGERDPIDHEVSSVMLQLYMKLQIYKNRLVIFPVKFLGMGIREKLKSIYVWANLAGFAFFIFAAWFFSTPSNARTEAANIIIWALWPVMIFPMFLVIFAMPSSYADSGVSPENVKSVVTHLENHGFTTAKEIELLQKSVKPREDRVRSRVTALKWIVSLIWAVLGYTFTKFSDPKFSDPKVIESSIPQITLLLFTLLTAYLFVWGYEAALDKLYRSIEFGCNDFCHQVEQPKETES